MWKDAGEKSAFWTPCGDRSIVDNVGRGSALELGGWCREERRKRREGAGIGVHFDRVNNRRLVRATYGEIWP